MPLKATADAQVLKAMEALRRTILGLDPNIREEARPHRLSYNRGTSMRAFLHLVPMKGELRVEVLKKQRGAPPFVWEPFTVKTEEDVKDLVGIINEAYHSV